MTEAELVAYNYGQRITWAYNQVTSANNLYPEVGSYLPGEAEYAAIEKLGLRKFSEWMQRGRIDKAGH